MSPTWESIPPFSRYGQGDAHMSLWQILKDSGYDPDVAPFPGLPSLTRGYNAALFTGATNEAKITAAIAKAVADGKTYVYVPASMLPYNASLVTFNNSIQMIREGGNPNEYDAQAYGAWGDGVTNDTYSFAAAIRCASQSPVNGGRVTFGPTASNTYLLGAAGAMDAAAVLLLYAPIVFQAEGGGDLSPTLKLANGTNLSMIKIFTNSQGVAINNMHLEGNKANQSGTSHGIFWDGDGAYRDKRDQVNHVFVNDFLTNGVYVKAQTAQIDFNRVIVRAAGGDGWNIEGSDCQMWKSDSQSCGGRGVLFNGGFIVWVGGAWYANTTIGAQIGASTTGIKISKMDIDSNLQHGVQIDGNNISVEDCTFRDNGKQTTATYSHVRVLTTLFGIRVVNNHFKAFTQANQAAYAVRLEGPLTASVIADNTEEPTSSAAGVLVTGSPGIGFVYRSAAGNRAGSQALVFTNLDGLITVFWQATMATDMRAGTHFYVVAGTNIAGTLSAPVNPTAIAATSQEVVYEIKNNSGGALTTPVAFAGGAGGFKTTGGVSPANGLRIIVKFRYNITDNAFVEVCRTSAAV